MRIVTIHKQRGSFTIPKIYREKLGLKPNEELLIKETHDQGFALFRGNYGIVSRKIDENYKIILPKVVADFLGGKAECYLMRETIYLYPLKNRI